jgi:hypothetical protein
MYKNRNMMDNALYEGIFGKDRLIQIDRQPAVQERASLCSANPYHRAAVTYLSHYRISAQCRHADGLKSSVCGFAGGPNALRSHSEDCPAIPKRRIPAVIGHSEFEESAERRADGGKALRPARNLDQIAITALVNDKR